MDGFIKKLIGRLEEKVHSYYKQYMDDIIGYSTYNEHKREITGIIEIVNQLAEEYKPKTNEDIQEVIDCLEVYTAGRLNTSKVEISVLQLQRCINRLKQIGE